MYRTIAWKAIEDGIDLTDETGIAALAQRVRLQVGDGIVRADGQDVARFIRTPEVDAAAAAVARQPRVREVLIHQQREMGRAGAVVMEGRDIGTVVFPNADVKVFLDASPDERARRRATDPAHAASRSGAAVKDIASALEARDLSDRTRTASPLAVAPDALVIDTTGMTIDEVVERVMDAVKKDRR
jgi:cytidylate kinase